MKKENVQDAWSVLIFAIEGQYKLSTQEWSINAIIDSGKCINCNACLKAGKNNRKQELTRPIYWKQG